MESCPYCGGNLKIEFYPKIRLATNYTVKVPPPPGVADRNITRTKSGEAELEMEGFRICQQCGAVYQYQSGPLYHPNGDATINAGGFVAVQPEVLAEHRKKWLEMRNRKGAQVLGTPRGIE